jgi:uncharacterized protein YggU (UPF0235/DUF167 family)
VNGFWRVTPDGVTVLIKVQPKSRRPGVTEAAEGGRANDAVRTLLAKIMDVPRSAVTIAMGETSRDKLLRIDGDATTLVARLSAL